MQEAYGELEKQAQERIAELAIASERAEEALRLRSDELALLNRSTQAFNSTLDLAQVLVTVLEEVRHLLGVVACSIWLIDPETGDLVGEQATGARSEIVRGWRLAMGEGFAGLAAQTGQPLIVADARADGRHFREIDLRTRVEPRSILSVPLQVKDRVIGVLQVLDGRPGRFGAADLMLLEPLAASAAIAIENARLYEETERLRAFNENIVQSMEEGILLEDEKGQITFINRKAAELLGYGHQELVGQHWTDIVVPEHVAQVEEKKVRLSQGVVSRYETVLLTREDAQMPVLVSACPLFDEGRFSGVLVVFTDITERRQAEEALRRQNAELTTLNAIAATISQELDLDHILDATLDKVLEMVKMDAGWIQLIDRDVDGNSLSLAAHYGISEDVIQELNIIRLGRGIMARVIRSRKPAKMTGALDDSLIDVRSPKPRASWTLAAIPIQARDNVLGVLNVLSCDSPDLTSHDTQILTAIGHQIGMAVENMRLLEEASEIQILRELDRLRSELIANVSHELRTPLGLIKVFATTLMREDVDLDQATQREFLRDIERETDRLEEIVRNLLDLSRMEDGRLHLEKRPTDLGQLVKETMEEMESQLAGQHFVHDFPEPLVAAVDSGRIAQVLRNLLSNAIKYSPEGGAITVRGHREERQVLIQVSDQGIGIPTKDLEKVFERFYRVENEITQSIGGVGLGLSVCRGIVRAHGGRIWVESTLGEGSVFCFSLPIGAVVSSQ